MIKVKYLILSFSSTYPVWSVVESIPKAVRSEHSSSTRSYIVYTWPVLDTYILEELGLTLKNILGMSKSLHVEIYSRKMSDLSRNN